MMFIGQHLLLPEIMGAPFSVMYFLLGFLFYPKGILQKERFYFVLFFCKSFSDRVYTYVSVISEILLLMVLVTVCDHKILVIVLQMEKSKKSTWIG
jgi:hypothetical protein